MIRPTPNKKLYRTVAILLVAYVLLALFLTVLDYDFFRADVKSYWNDSLHWRTPYHPFHVPGYPLTIALLRGISLNMMPPVTLMMLITAASFVASVILVYNIIHVAGISERFALLGASLFGLWPFVGLVEAVSPRADLPAIALFLAGLYLLQKEHPTAAAASFALALVTHKAMWPLVGLIALAYFFEHRPSLSRRNVSNVAILFLPITVLWLAGTVYHGSPTWMVTSNLEVEIATEGGLPLFRGVILTILEGGLGSFVKGATVLASGLLAVTILVASIWFRPPYYRYGIAIGTAILLLVVVLNDYEIWAVVRYSRLLVIPGMWLLGSYARDGIVTHPLIIASFLLFAFLSQFAFAWYMATIFVS